MSKRLIYSFPSVLIFCLVAGLAYGQPININFQLQGSSVPEDYLPDSGEAFADRGNGYSYGWDMDIQGDARERNTTSDQRYDTLVQMQEGEARTWEIELPNGGYDVFLACGDPSYNDQICTMDVEGTVLVDLDGRDNFDEYNLTVIVSDGRLTIQPAAGGIKCKVMFVHIMRIELLKAHDPDPAIDALHLDTWVSVSWSPGDRAVSHDVYFSDNLDDVSSGDAEAFRGNQTDTSYIAGDLGYAYPDGLVPGTTYYWRIDEVNESNPDSPWEGDVWNFTVPVRTAYNPAPADGAIFVEPGASLSWEAGFGAVLHTVYFGDDFDVVDNATGGAAQEATTYTPDQIAKGTVYYWRVDETDDVTTHRGEVWTFATVPDIEIADPNLLCWWKFDEVQEGTVIDYSGHDHFGTVHGVSLILDGRVGGALDFDGSGDYVVDEDAEDYLNGLSALTVCMWIKSNLTGTDRGFIDCEQPDGSDQMITMRYDLSGGSYGGRNVIKMAVTSTPDWEQQLESSSNVQTTEWQHVAMTWSSGDVIRLYINGIEDTSTGRTEPNDAGGTTTDCTTLLIGKGGKDLGTTAGWNGLIDDVRIYDKALAVDEISQAMRGEADLAWNPSPANGSTPDIKNVLPLSWSSGDWAAQHDVYFGTDLDTVANADASDTTGIYRGRQTDTSYTPSEIVEWGGGPYYWRVDEYNTDATISKGKVWSFIVADFLLIDDFEDYNDYEPDRIFDTWMDGYGVEQNGSTVGYADPDFEAGEHFVEMSVIHGGYQSMPYFYDNSSAGNSEATLTLEHLNDWTEYGVNTLSLWFRGNPADFIEEPAGTYTIAATGADISGLNDEFRYAFKRLSGAGSISAQVVSVQNTDEWAKAGVMIRRTLDPSSPFAAAYITPGNGCRFQGRLALGGNVTSDTPVATPEQRAITAPYWVKIERDDAGSFNGYYSNDSVNWVAMSWNPQSVSMPSDVYIGLAVTSHNVNAACKAVFSDVQTTGEVSPQTWTQQAIGVDMPSNDAERMYVVLNDSTLVYNDNPNAVLIDEWTQWNIDLQAFADQGVDLTNVDTIGIGFGDKGNPQPGGSGLVFFDDIRLYSLPPSEVAEP